MIAAARSEGIPDSWLDAARESPVYKLAIDWKLALPLHPEYRTLPMVWYVPPLSPVQSAADAGKVGLNGEIPDVASLRIPVRYLANLLTAGDEAPVIRAMERMLAMRAWRRSMNVDGVDDTAVLAQGVSASHRRRRCTATSRSPTTRTASSCRAPTANTPTTCSANAAAAASRSATDAAGVPAEALFGGRSTSTYQVPPARQRPHRERA